jgi:hypothetical protein
VTFLFEGGGLGGGGAGFKIAVKMQMYVAECSIDSDSVADNCIKLKFCLLFGTVSYERT